MKILIHHKIDDSKKRPQIDKIHNGEKFSNFLKTRIKEKNERNRTIISIAHFVVLTKIFFSFENKKIAVEALGSFFY